MNLYDLDLNKKILNNPLIIQQLIISDFEQRLNNNFTIADPNNTFALLLEYTSTLIANAVSQEENKLSKIYPNRSISFDDLWPHMSDYDYVNFFSTPATTNIHLILSKDYLAENAVPFNQYYRKVVIPRNTIFTIGDLKFGLYYPIELRLNTETGRFIALFDTSVTNPLYKLSTNVLNIAERKFDNMNLLIIDVPLYQFECFNLSGEIIPNVGFNQTYKINSGKFYAIRIFNENRTLNTTIELRQTLAEYVYDPYYVTAKIKINPDENSVNIIIPRIYLMDGRIAGKINIELYTTQGAINVDFTNIDMKTIKVDYQLKLTPNKYSDILIYNPTEIVELQEGVINGGSNGKTFEEARDLIINHGEHKDVLINQIDVQTYFAEQQFRIKKEKDNITDRIYYCYKNILDTQNSIIPTTSSNIKITNTSPTEIKSILKQIDDTLTIFPETLYRYNDMEQCCYPVTNTEIDELTLKTKSELVDIYNKNIYTRCPFHILFIPHNKYPEAVAFNLWDPTCESVWFTAAHNEVASQMVIKGGKPFHLLGGTGGWEVQLILTKVGDLIDIPEEDILILATTKTIDGNIITFPVEYLRNSEPDTIYKFNIKSTYQLTKDENIAVFYDTSLLTTQLIPLTSTFNIICMVKKQYYPYIQNMYDITDTIINTSITDQYLGLSKHEIILNLGHELSTVLHFNVDIRWSPKEYETYEMDIPLVYPNDVFDSYVENNTIHVHKLYNKGDQIKDDQDQPIIQYHQGDIRLNASGEPMLKRDRSVEYLIDILHISNNIYISENQIQKDFCETLPNSLEKIFDFLRTTHSILGELMQLYFKPTKTFGYGQFHLGDGSVTMLPLNMKFKFDFYVPKFIMNSVALQQTILDTSIRLIESHIYNNDINLANIAYLLKEAMPDYLYHIDVLGIDNKLTLQTLIRINDDIQPSLNQELYLTKDGSFAIKKGLEVEFKDVDYRL
jgi:hypothetical protein